MLIVEDEPMLGFMLQDMIENLGGTVIGWAESRPEAERLACSSSYDLAILDINLNGEPSYPAAKKIAERGKRFFFVTGYAHVDIPSELAHVPVVDKPYTVERLITAADVVLHRE